MGIPDHSLEDFSNIILLFQLVLQLIHKEPFTLKLWMCSPSILLQSPSLVVEILVEQGRV